MAVSGQALGRYRMTRVFSATTRLHGMNRVEGVVEVERDALRHLAGSRIVAGHHGARHQVSALGSLGVLEARQRWRRAQRSRLGYASGCPSRPPAGPDCNSHARRRSWAKSPDCTQQQEPPAAFGGRLHATRESYVPGSHRCSILLSYNLSLLVRAPR
jgi:hypothetical protein